VVVEGCALIKAIELVPALPWNRKLKPRSRMTLKLLMYTVAVLVSLSEAFTNHLPMKRSQEARSKMCLEMIQIDKKAIATSIAAVFLAGVVSTDVVLAQPPSSETVAGIEIVPAGGGGFGGLGITPFSAGPFGGFGTWSKLSELFWMSYILLKNLTFLSTNSRQDLALAFVQRQSEECVFGSRMIWK